MSPHMRLAFNGEKLINIVTESYMQPAQRPIFFIYCVWHMFIGAYEFMNWLQLVSAYVARSK